MTDQEGDRGYYLTQKWPVTLGFASGDRPFLETPPESRESNSIPVTRGISHYMFYYTIIIHNGNT